MFDRNKVIEIALSEVGYREKASNSGLDDPNVNAGAANYTKYARDLDNIKEFYNGGKNGYAWCDVFVDWCFVKAYGVDAAKDLLCQPDNSLGAGTKYSAQYYKDKGQFHTTPEIGDQIFFGVNGGDHTGLVYDIKGTNVHTVEGNTADCVATHVYTVNNPNIYGYGRPDYSDSWRTEEGVNVDAEEPVSDADMYCKTVLPVLSKGSTGVGVELIQYALCRKGYLPENSRKQNGFFDGEFGSGTENALIAFQTACSVSPIETGKTGSETIAFLFG